MNLLPPALPPFPVRRFSVQEFQQMAAVGILTEQDDVELLEGWITPKMIHNPPHDLVVGLVDDALRARLPDAWKLRTQSAIVTEDSRPEPDLVVVRGPLRRYSERHPKPNDIAMVVEIADTSLARDRSKCALYARAGIEVFWIVNLVDRNAEVYLQPNRQADPPSFGQRTVYSERESIPIEIGGRELPSVPLAELLP
jgi:Uma2 family endonuclease